MFNTADRLVKAHLEFCNLRAQTYQFLLVRSITYVARTLCFNLRSIFALITVVMTMFVRATRIVNGYPDF